MNTQIIGYRISYFIFSVFVSCLIVFTIHKGFQRQDIITIPIFAILLFLIIDFSAKSMYQHKMENFLNEGFDSKLLDRFKNEELAEEEEMMRKESVMQEDMNKKATIDLQTLAKSGFVYKNEELAEEEEMMRKESVMQEDMNKKATIDLQTLAKSGFVYKNEELEEEEMMRRAQIMEEEEMMRKVPVMGEEMIRRGPIMEEEEMMRKAPVMEEEETYQKYASVNDKPKEKSNGYKPSSTPSGDKKAKEATDKQEERPDINKHLMDDGNNGLSNRNSETINPININVSYNNNRPYTVNDFNNADIDKNRSKRLKPNDINNYRFDDGCMKPSNSNINQKYYPAYLKNPLNKNQPKVSDNYEVKMMKRILNEQNDPSPVCLEKPWSEWKPID